MLLGQKVTQHLNSFFFFFLKTEEEALSNMTYHNSKTNVKIILLIIHSKKSRLKHNTPLSKKDYKKLYSCFKYLLII